MKENASHPYISKVKNNEDMHRLQNNCVSGKLAAAEGQNRKPIMFCSWTAQKHPQNCMSNWAVPLSGEGVVSSHSVVATGLVSRHRSEFGTLRAVRFCGLEALAQAILGVLESLQRRSKTARLQAAAQLRNRSLPASLGSFRTAANFLRKLPSSWPAVYRASEQLASSLSSFRAAGQQSNELPSCCQQSIELPSCCQQSIELPSCCQQSIELPSCCQQSIELPRRRRNKARSARAQAACERNASLSNTCPADLCRLPACPTASRAISRLPAS